MPGRLIRLFACALLLTSAQASTLTAQVKADCDRGCLRTTLDQYLRAVIAHDPAAAPLFVAFRQTENAINVPRGEGVWKTITGLGKVQRRFFDPVTGQAGYYGIVEEGTTLAIVTVRVRVEQRRITEAEWFIARAGDPGLRGPARPGQPPPNLFNPDALTASPPPDRTLPPAKRAPREVLLAVTNSYFDGITSHDGTVIMAHSGCSRIENGTLVTVPGPSGGPNSNTPVVDRDCAFGLKTFDLAMVVGRRLPLVDEEAGVVLGLAIFIRRPGSTTPRNVFSEWFFIDDNKIRSIYTAMFYPGPDLAVPNWPQYEGHWPLPAPAAPAPAPASR